MVSEVTLGLADVGDVNDETENMYLNFNVGSGIYGIEIRNVLQIIGMQEINEMPDMSPYMKGFINLRGNVIPVVSIRLRFGQLEEEYTDRTCIIVVQNGDGKIGLIVDAIRETITIDPESISPKPTVEKNEYSDYIIGIARLTDNCSAVLIDSQKLFAD